MSPFQIIAILVSLAAAFSYINFKFLKLPNTVGVMLLALIMSVVLIVAGRYEIGFRGYAANLVSGINFEKVLLHGILSFLLFAGSLQLDLNDLKKEWLP